MKTIFDFEDYRAFLIYLCKEADHGPSQVSLARAAGCQASYFSQALRGQVQLTEDQCLGIAQYLNLTDTETEHLFLLIRFAKAGTKKLKDYLEKSIQTSKRSQLNLTELVAADQVKASGEEIGQYSSSWLPSAIHILTSSPEHRSVESISRRLSISTQKTKSILLMLQKMGFVAYENGSWVFKNGSIHIPKASPWDISYQSSRRNLAIKSIVEGNSEDLHFSSVFTMDKEDEQQIKKIISSSVEKSHKVIKHSGVEELYCLCMDFFIIS